MALTDIVFSVGTIAEGITDVGSLNIPINIVYDDVLTIELKERPKSKIIDSKSSNKNIGQS